MGYSARILAHSVNPVGCELLTFEATYPRFVHAEMMTHRVFSRNAASSRAIPIQKMIAAVARDPAGPVWWGKNQAGMQARAELSGWRAWAAKRAWYGARWIAIAIAWLLWKIGVHKQIANRVLEPWMWITVIISATEWANFFALRAHPDAQPEIRHIADMMLDEYRRSTPRSLRHGELHLPLCEDREELESDGWLEKGIKQIVTGRLARVSYLTHDGRRSPEDDVRLHNDLSSADPGHWSPFEHVATALATDERSGNFRGFRQYREEFPGEAGPAKVRA